MTIEADIYTALKGLVGNRCFPDFAPLSTVRPYITYVQIGGEPLATVGGVSSLKHGRIQVNVWGDSRSVCSATMKQIEAALVAASPFTARPLSALSSAYDHDMMVYSAMQDFSIYSPR